MGKPGARPPSQQALERTEVVKQCLTKNDAAGADFQIDIDQCPVLTSGFRGMFRWRQTQAGKILRGEIDKNPHSHVHEALQYGLSMHFRLFQLPSKGPRQRPFLSGANASRRRRPQSGRQWRRWN